MALLEVFPVENIDATKLCIVELRLILNQEY